MTKRTKKAKTPPKTFNNIGDLLDRFYPRAGEGHESRVRVSAAGDRAREERDHYQAQCEAQEVNRRIYRRDHGSEPDF